MIYLAAIFIPSPQFSPRKQWIGFVINSIFYGLACLFVLSIVGMVIAPFFWLIAMFHAMWHVKKEMFVQNAEILTTKMAEKMRQQS
jgi:hypothetical protein